MLFLENIIYNEQTPDLSDDDEFSDDEMEQQEESPPTPEEEINQHLEPMKRYYLISNLLNVQTALNKTNINNDILDLLVKFSDNISYGHLTIIVPNLLSMIDQDLKRSNNAKKDK